MGLSGKKKLPHLPTKLNKIRYINRMIMKKVKNMCNRTTLNIVISTLLILFTLTSCKEDKPVDTPLPGETPVMLEAVLNPYYNGEPLELDQVVETPQGYPIRVREVKFFMTMLTNNEKTMVKSAKLDWASDGLTIFHVPGEPTDFSNIHGFLGVIEEWNHRDPVSFEDTDPLYLTNANDMHWSWNPGYIFVKIEGSHDTIPGSAVFPFNYSFHLGMNQHRKEFNWENIQWTKVNEKLYRMSLKVDLYEFFDGPGGVIDLKTEYVTHSMPDSEALTNKAMVNFYNAMYVNQ